MQRKGRNTGKQADDVRDRWCDGWQGSLFSACMCLCTPECVRMLLLLASGEGYIDGRGASFAVSAVEVL